MIYEESTFNWLYNIRIRHRYYLVCNLFFVIFSLAIAWFRNKFRVTPESRSRLLLPNRLKLALRAHLGCITQTNDLVSVWSTSKFGPMEWLEYEIINNLVSITRQGTLGDKMTATRWSIFQKLRSWIHESHYLKNLSVRVRLLHKKWYTLSFYSTSIKAVILREQRIGWRAEKVRYGSDCIVQVGVTW